MSMPRLCGFDVEGGACEGAAVKLYVPQVRIVCIPCGTLYTGEARVGQPCAYCLTPLVDEHAVIAKAAATYDPIRWVVVEAA